MRRFYIYLAIFGVMLFAGHGFFKAHKFDQSVHAISGLEGTDIGEILGLNGSRNIVRRINDHQGLPQFAQAATDIAPFD